TRSAPIVTGGVLPSHNISPSGFLRSNIHRMSSGTSIAGIKRSSGSSQRTKTSSGSSNNWPIPSSGGKGGGTSFGSSNNSPIPSSGGKGGGTSSNGSSTGAISTSPSRRGDTITSPSHGGES